MLPTFDGVAVQQTIIKNRSTSYGLTIVLGLPVPSRFGRQISLLQASIERQLPRTFRWYEVDQLHTTIVAPLRGRYREAPALQPSELPVHYDEMVAQLRLLAASMPPISLDFQTIRFVPNGLVAVQYRGGEQLRASIAAVLQPYPGFDRPKDQSNFHLTVGYLQKVPAQLNHQERTTLQTIALSVGEESLGEVNFDRMWLVHYANRTLDAIVTKLALPFGGAGP